MTDTSGTAADRTSHADDEVETSELQPLPNDNNNNDDNDDKTALTLTISHHSTPHTFHLPQAFTIHDLAAHLTTHLSIPTSHQKLLIPGHKPALLKPPFPQTPLAPFTSRKITLLGPTPAELAALNTTLSRATQPRKPSPIPIARPARTTSGLHSLTPSSSSAAYTFNTILPLPHLPSPSRSRALLERLASDRGIQAAMARFHLRVGVLTEMDPRAHTSVSHGGGGVSRTLGLNRNAGEVVELRLWTDDFAGMRDYRTVRRTLCHELAHCRFAEHDAAFWRFCRDIEELVEGVQAGRTLGGEVYRPPEEREAPDGGGWEGGEYVLGGGERGGAGSAPRENEGLTRREVLAKAAEERMKRLGKGGGADAEKGGGATEK